MEIKISSAMERINQKETIYICYDKDGVQFGSASESQARIYARLNKCEISIYPPKCYNGTSTY
jgi:hypothetical protein